MSGSEKKIISCIMGHDIYTHIHAHEYIQKCREKEREGRGDIESVYLSAWRLAL